MPSVNRTSEVRDQKSEVSPCAAGAGVSSSAGHCASASPGTTNHEPRATNSSGKAYWRSVDDLADTPEFREFVHREFPNTAGELLESGRAGSQAVPEDHERIAGAGGRGHERLPALACDVSGAVRASPRGPHARHARALRHEHGLRGRGRGTARDQLRRPADQDRGQPAASDQSRLDDAGDAGRDSRSVRSGSQPHADSCRQRLDVE